MSLKLPFGAVVGRVPKRCAASSTRPSSGSMANALAFLNEFSRNEEDQKARITRGKCTDGSGLEQGKCALGRLLSTPFVSDTIPALKRKDRMSEETPTQPFSGGEQPQQQQIQVMLDEREMRTIYSNAYRFHTTADEVVLDVG